MTIAENIKRERENRGVKQSTIAEKLGLDRSNYHRIENREKKLTIEQLELIADAIGCTLFDLLGGVSEYENKEIQALNEVIEGIQEDNRMLLDYIDLMTYFYKVEYNKAKGKPVPEITSDFVRKTYWLLTLIPDKSNLFVELETIRQKLDQYALDRKLKKDKMK